MRNIELLRLIILFSLVLSAICIFESWSKSDTENPARENNTNQKNYQGKLVVYQVFTRLFGNRNTTNKPWGTIKENGVGKFNDFTDKALKGIKEFGTTHIWYTGVPHHAVINDYTQYGISNDDPDVVKGRAGSPYAVKDYYNVNPDLAVNPTKRLQEFRDLIVRTHKHNMKVIIDIVPNHIARDYQSISKPDGVEDFGASDNTGVDYARDNNFYYIVGERFIVPRSNDGYSPLNGEKHSLSDGMFSEYPAKWTGNGSRKPQPDINDWYETVKVNYGVRPDGSFDFIRLPRGYESKSIEEHYQFWTNKAVPDSWRKFKDIALYWIDMGVDGFRYDMAEMVPVEFWSYLNSSIKNREADTILIAEVYNPKIYRDFIHLGKMDYLYDKVDFYDTIKLVMQGKLPTSSLLPVVNKFNDIEQHLLHFLENHDEQRIASTEFAGDATKGKPAMVVSALIGQSPTMLYFAQALGETGDESAGFGGPSRTSIFDYWGVDSLQRWMNLGLFDGAQLTAKEKRLRAFYVKLLSFSANSFAMTGEYADLHAHNLQNTENYNESLFSFLRWKGEQKVIVVSNFSDAKSFEFELKIPQVLIEKMRLNSREYRLRDVLADKTDRFTKLVIRESGEIMIKLAPLESTVLYIE